MDDDGFGWWMTTVTDDRWGADSGVVDGSLRYSEMFYTVPIDEVINASETRSAFVFMVISNTLKMKALNFSEASITIYQWTRYNNPADMNLQTVML